ncbi:MAG TPA: TonB-dependent receptor [Chitinophagaceae bacterium]|nr:TonB-dependent receptor [Chitinophagaceae bacterium]
MPTNYRLPFFAILFFTSFHVHAQNKVIDLQDVTVSASLLQQQQKETGRNIINISGEEIAKLPVHSLDELLKYIPGVEVQQRGPQGAQSDINIRGGTFQQVLVIIDGVKLNDPITGHFNSYIPINPAGIQRIEILKGAASAIYGSEAVGGVINIITKTFAQTIAKGKTFTAGMSVGENNLWNGNGYFSTSTDKSTLAVSLQTNNAKGEQLRGTTGYFHTTTAVTSFSHQFRNDWRASLRIAADFRDFNAQNFYTTYGSDTAHEKVNAFWTQMNLHKKTKNGLLNFDMGFKKLKDNFWFNPHSIPNDNRSSLFSSQVYYNWQIQKKYSITPGVQFISKRINSNDRGNHSIAHGAVYTIFRQEWAKDIYTNASLRLDWDERYGAVLIPQINFAWTPNRFTLRAAAGRSIRDGDFTERYNNYNKPLVTSGTIGNPDLLPEKAWNFECGIDYRAHRNWQFRSSYFYSHHKGLIDFAPTPYADMPRKDNLVPGGSYSLAKNIESIRTSGVEFGVLFRKKINQQSNMQAMMGYTYIHSKNKDSIPSFYISSHARHLFNFLFQYTSHSFLIAFNGLYKNRNKAEAASIGAEITSSYFLANVKLGYFFAAQKAQLYIQADNLFDEKYSDLLGAQMPGRWLSAGIQVTLQPK